MKSYSILVLFLILFLSCTKEENGLDVSVMGFVRLFGENGYEIFDRKDVKISVGGTSVETFTNENGKYLVSNLRAGKKYRFEFSKDGYGNKNINSVQFLGEGKPGLLSTVTLYKIPSYELLNATLTNESGFIRLSGTTTETDSYRVIAYINDSSNVSDSHYDRYDRYQSILIGSHMTAFSFYIYLIDMNYVAGTTVYVVIYFYNSYETNFTNPDPGLLSSGKKASQILQITI